MKTPSLLPCLLTTHLQPLTDGATIYHRHPNPNPNASYSPCPMMDSTCPQKSSIHRHCHPNLHHRSQPCQTCQKPHPHSTWSLLTCATPYHHFPTCHQVCAIHHHPILFLPCYYQSNLVVSSTRQHSNLVRSNLASSTHHRTYFIT